MLIILKVQNKATFEREDFSEVFVGSNQCSSLEDTLFSTFYCFLSALCLLKIKILFFQKEMVNYFF